MATEDSVFSIFPKKDSVTDEFYGVINISMIDNLPKNNKNEINNNFITRQIQKNSGQYLVNVFSFIEKTDIEVNKNKFVVQDNDRVFILMYNDTHNDIAILNRIISTFTLF